jgi:hypothetical protein
MSNHQSRSKKPTARIVLRPGDVDFDARKLRDLEVTEDWGVEVKGGAYRRSSRNVHCDCCLDC